MNTVHLKYAVEVAKSGGLNKAAENLLIAPSNLSRAIKELEKDLGISIFERTSKGMSLTPRGEELILLADSVITRLDDIERMYKNTGDGFRFSVCVPRSLYILEAFHDTLKKADKLPCELRFDETDTASAVKCLFARSCDIGIIRTEKRCESRFYESITDKGFSCEVIAEFSPVITAGSGSTVSKTDKLTPADLAPLTEIFFSGESSLFLYPETVNKTARRIFVRDSMSACSLLREESSAFMRTEPIPKAALKSLGLIQKKCGGSEEIYRDILISRSGSELPGIVHEFIGSVKRYAAQLPTLM